MIYGTVRYSTKMLDTLIEINWKSHFTEKEMTQDCVKDTFASGSGCYQFVLMLSR